MKGAPRTKPNLDQRPGRRRTAVPNGAHDTGAWPKGKRARSVLAVLVLASQWNQRFVDGWVTDDDIGRHSRDFPTPRENDPHRRDTLKVYIREGLRELRMCRGVGRIVRERVASIIPSLRPLECATRLRPPVRASVREWFELHGVELLESDTQGAFRADEYGTFAGIHSTTVSVDEAVVYRLLDRGEAWEAEEHARRALKNAPDDHTRQVFTLALASIEIHEDDSRATARALCLLRPLVQVSPPPRSDNDRLLRVRLLIAYATALARLRPDDVAFEEELAQLPNHFSFEDEDAEQYLGQARRIIPGWATAEHGDLLFAEALIEERRYALASEEAAPGPDDAYKHHLVKAEMRLLSALKAWQLAMRWDRIRDGLKHISWGLSLDNLDFDRRRLLLPWLDATRRYFEAIAPDEPDPLHFIYLELLTSIHQIPDSCPIESLPLPPASLFSLVDHIAERQRALFERPGYEHNLTKAIRRRGWYQLLKGKYKDPPSDLVGPIAKR